MPDRRCRVPFLVLLGGLITTTAAAAQGPDLPESRGPAKGALFIHGGGNMSGKGGYADFFDLACKVTGKKTPKIVVITTAAGPRAKGKKGVLNPASGQFYKKLVGDDNVTVLFELDPKVANTDEFIKPINAADAIWMDGGEQVFLTDAFLGTKTEKAFRALLDRNGVIGGASAGAQCQSSFMTRAGLISETTSSATKNTNGDSRSSPTRPSTCM